MTTNVELYRHWLLHCVFVECWSTLHCARELKADPAMVQRDFEEALAELKQRNRIDGRKP